MLMPPRPLSRLVLTATRGGIDRIDDGMVRLFAHRQRLAGLAGTLKRRAGLPQHDAGREASVQQRAQQLAQRCGMPGDSVARLMALLIAEAHRRQRGGSSSTPPAIFDMHNPPESGQPSSLWRLLPPPRRWQPLATRLPLPLRQALGLRLLAPAVAPPQVMRVLQPVLRRRLGIRIDDLGLDWVFELHEDGLHLARQPAEATVSGSLTDLLLLASRQQDADTLFFQRKLTLTGDTELGLMLRNLLDRLPWDALPLGQRIVLQRSAVFARNARDAYRVTRPAA